MDLAWLSQVLGFTMISNFGVPGIQFLNGLGITLAGGFLTFTIFRRTQSLGAALLTLFAFYWASYQQLLVVRPQLGGMVCFVLVFVMATAPQWKRRFLFLIPAVFALWANLHGSFIMGLILLGAITVGRGVDVYLRTRRLNMVFAETGVRGLILALELSALAILLNPYGIGAYTEALTFSRNENLQSLIEWDPMTLRMKQGRAAFVLGLGLILLYRFSPRRVTVREVLLLGGLTFCMLWYSRMIVWWAPVAAYSLGLHAAAVYRQWKKSPPAERRVGGLWSVVAVGIAWIAFAYTPFGMRLLHGASKDPAFADKQFRQSLSPLTPIDITSYLKRNPPTGLVFTPYEWGDYVQWAGPEGIQVYVNSHAHLIPQEIWQDYLLIIRGGAGVEDRLDRYGVNTVVAEKTEGKELLESMERLASWEKKYSDRRGAVFVRKTAAKATPENEPDVTASH